jgi:outer membrane protein assembly factor BamB
LAGILGGIASRAADWPQFLGSSRDGTTPDAITNGSPEPGTLWKLRAGSGFAGPAVAQGKAFLFQRRNDEEVLTCVEALTGKVLWEKPSPTDYEDDFGFDNGPRAVPTVVAERVFTLGANGLLLARKIADGTRLWEFDARKEAGASKGFFGFACAPLVVGRWVLLNLGGPSGAGVAAFAADSGKLIWKRTGHEAGYASPTSVMIGPEPTGIFFTREGLVGVEVATGLERFVHPWRARMSASVNAASPLVRGNEIFLTASYGTGAILLAVEGGRLQEVWSGDDSLSAHYATPVRKDDLLFGFHGRQEQGPALRCIAWKTGRVKWSEGGFGAGTLALAGDQLVILRESGELVIAPALVSGFKPTGRAQIIGSNRAAFALADGILFARDKTSWVAVDLRAK